MTDLSAFMFSAIKHLVASELARMVLYKRTISELAANLIANMLTAASFLLAN